MKILCGSAHRQLADKIAEELDHPVADLELSVFPDGECFAKITENVRGQDVFILQPTCPPVNDNLMELLIIIDACRRASASRITAVIPYYGYARQDRKDQPRVPITAKLVANLLVQAGCTRMLTLDLHSEQIQGFFDIPLDHLYAYPEMIQYFKELELKDPVLVAPDPGSIKSADKYSRLLGAGLAFIGKRRVSADEVQGLHLVGEVEGRDCIIVDDMTSTAGTLCMAANLLKEHGATSIRAAVTHNLMTPKGVERLKKSTIQEFITTDSVPFKQPEGINLKVISIANLLGQAMLRIHNNQSVTSLFRVRD